MNGGDLAKENHAEHFLDDIIQSTREAVATAKRKYPPSELHRRIRDNELPRDFLSAVSPPEQGAIRLIAEIKKASPSRGILREDFHPVKIGRIYEEAGASALSVLTEERFFLGSLKYLKEVHDAVRLPILRKDFVLDEYQIFQARSMEADAVLLIVALLDDHQLKDYTEIAAGLGMGCLVEVHDEREVERALKSPSKMIGINNRNLKTFITDLDVTFRLCKGIPDQKVVIAESGISTAEDIQKLRREGLDAVLIGETFIKSKNIKEKVHELFEGS